MSRDKCPLCENSLIGTLNTRYCRNPKCELYDEPLQGRLLDIITETQALLDKEMKDHWHKHRIALRLKRQLEIAVDALKRIKNHATAIDTAICRAEIALEQITTLEQKDVK